MTDELDLLFPAHLQRVGGLVESALAAEGYGSLVVHSGFARCAFLDDQAYPFRPNPHFRWAVPVGDAPDCLLVWEPGRRPRLLFVSPADYWHLPPRLPDGAWTACFDVEPHADVSSAWAAIRPASGRAFIGEVPPAFPAESFAAVNPERLLQRLHDGRVRKSAYEIACLRLATRAGVAGHHAAARAFEAGGSEWEILLAFLAGCGQREHELPYQAIVACDAHAATLHYQSVDRSRPAARHSLLIDAGAQFRGYASDITRTHASSPGLFRDLVREMDHAQQSLAAAVRPGVDWRDLHLTAHQLVAEVLKEAGILRIDPDEAVHNGLSDVFLPHGLGHLLGLQTHDVGGFRARPLDEPVPPPEGHRALRLTRILEEGFVVTMEPGLYFIDMKLAGARQGPLSGAIDWQLVDALRPCGGIRIEDNLVVTAGGSENLTRDAFRAPG
jgi:Xaa-Pro dipeptidase